MLKVLSEGARVQTRGGREEMEVQTPAGETIASRLRGRRKALTAAELAETLSLSKKHIYELAKIGRIPHFRIGYSVRFDPATIANWLEVRSIRVR